MTEHKVSIDKSTNKNVSSVFGNLYHSQGINDPNLPKRIMKFVVSESEKSNQGQGIIALECKKLWEMTIPEFEATFDVKIMQEAPLLPFNDEEMMIDLDHLFGEAYFYTKYDIGGSGHSITIKKRDKERFLDAMATEFRERVESMLVDVKEE